MQLDPKAVEAACAAHAPMWAGIDPEIKKYAREQMKAAILAYLSTAGGEAEPAGWVSGEGAMKLAMGSPAIIDPKRDDACDVTIPLFTHPQHEPVGVKVKPLEWKEAVVSSEIRGGETVIAQSVFGKYQAFGDGAWDDGRNFHTVAPSFKGSLTTAKAAAQADYERRIHPPSPHIKKQPRTIFPTPAIWCWKAMCWRHESRQSGCLPHAWG
jgi:hypothetical protein